MPCTQQTSDHQSAVQQTFAQQTSEQQTPELPMTESLGLGLRWNKNHPLELVIGNPSSSVRTIKQILESFSNSAFILQIEPKKADEVLLDPDWINTMQE